ncbi:MAG: CRISPR system precrRNA processing endoribonuclease RAMP protein Cas6 [Myxococcota bacterium]
MLDSLTRHTLLVRPLDVGWDPTFSGTIVRSVLGKALHELACDRECVEECARGPGCAYQDYFVAGGEPPWRLDASALDTPLAPREIRPLSLVTWHPGASESLLAALRLALPQGLGPSENRVRFAVQEETSSAIDLVARAGVIAEGGVLRLVTPTWLRTPTWDDTPNPSDLFSALRGRLKQAGAMSPGLPWAEPELAARPIGGRYVQLKHHSQAQQRDYEVRGWVGSWRIRPTPAQSVWLALAEAIGVGKGTTRGQGVIRVEAEIA